MALQLRQYNQILRDSLNHVVANSGATDGNVGSVTRSILEAAALEDEEQYFQIAQLLKYFSIKNTKGNDLLRRVQDYDIEGKLPPTSATVDVVIQDTQLTRAGLGEAVSTGATSIIIDDISVFENLTPNFVVRIGEGTSFVEDKLVTDVDVFNDTLEFGTGTAFLYQEFDEFLSNDHARGATVSLVTDDPATLPADKIISAGTKVERPATSTDAAVEFILQETAVINPGNYSSNSVGALAVVSGPNGRIGSSAISAFTSGPPFPGAAVTNADASVGGTPEETDEQLQDRAIRSQYLKTAATKTSIEANLGGYFDLESNKQISTVRVREDFIDDIVRVFIDDSTGLVPTRNAFARSTLAVDITTVTGSQSLPLEPTTAGDFPDSGYALVGGTSIFKYDSKQGNTLIIDSTLHPTGTNGLTFSAGDDVLLVELSEDSAELGQEYVFAKLFPLEPNSLEVYTATFPEASGLFTSTSVPAADYEVNLGTGQVQFYSPLNSGDAVFLHYSNYEGLVQAAQIILNGDEDDLVNFPGVRAQGVRAVVEPPTIINVTARMAITAKDKFNENNLRPLVQEAVFQYINGLNIGDDLIVSEIVKVSQNIDGVLDTTVSTPTSNIVAAEDELVRIDIDDILVT